MNHRRASRSLLCLSIVPCLALGLFACVDAPELGAEESELGIGARPGAARTIEPITMDALYYGINPPRHAEKAYRVGDPALSLSAQPTVVDSSGTVVVLVTTIYNRPPFGRSARVSVCDETGASLATLVVATPGRIDLLDLAPGSAVYIRPETIGTMAKLLTPEQIAGARP